MAVEYGKNIRKRLRGASWPRDAVESALQAIIVAINAAEAKGRKSIAAAFTSVFPEWTAKLQELGVTVCLHRQTDAAGADPRPVGDMGWHWDKVYNDFNDPWFTYEWRLSWDTLVDAGDKDDASSTSNVGGTPTK